MAGLSTFDHRNNCGGRVGWEDGNEVVEFDEPSLIAWRHMGGHIWRYRLRPVDGGTEVTEEFDWRPSKSGLAIKLTAAPKRNAKAIEATLDRLAAHFAPTA